MPRKIAFVTGSFHPGGTEHYLLRMLRALDRTRFVPFVVTLEDGGILEDAVRALAPVHVVKLTGKLFNRQGLRELRRLSRRLREEQAELVHVLIDRATIYGALGARLAGNLPVVASHRYTVLPVGRGLTVLYHLTFRFFVWHVIPNSHASVPQVSRMGVPRRCITVVHNGIPRERVRPFVEPQAGRSRVVICSVGRLGWVKGQHLLLEAASRLRRDGVDVGLVMVGSGPDEERLRQQAVGLGIADCIEWTGYLPDPMPVIERSDICVLTSYNEGFPNVVVEYFAAGRPVVATAVGGVPEIVRPEENGLLVPPGDAKALASALTRLAEDGELRRRMGRNGRALVERELTVEVEMARTQEVYERVLAQRGKR